MNLEQAVEKLGEEFDSLGIGKLMINKGFPIFEIWIEDLHGDEVLLHSNIYENKFESKNIDEIGLLELEEIRFVEIEETVTYLKLKELVYTEILHYYQRIQENMKVSDLTEYSYISMFIHTNMKERLIEKYGTLEKVQSRFENLKILLNYQKVEYY